MVLSDDDEDDDDEEEEEGCTAVTALIASASLLNNHISEVSLSKAPHQEMGAPRGAPCRRL